MAYPCPGVTMPWSSTEKRKQELDTCIQETTLKVASIFAVWIILLATGAWTCWQQQMV